MKAARIILAVMLVGLVATLALSGWWRCGVQAGPFAGVVMAGVVGFGHDLYAVPVHVDRHGGGLALFNFWTFESGPGPDWIIAVPLYLPTVIVAALLALVCWRCRRRPGPGCCQWCGYDLRATPERCPECGVVF